MIKPLFISVDTEFTDGNLHTGGLLQVAFASNETERVGQWVLPISTDVTVNDWSWEHQPGLVNACLKLQLQGRDIRLIAREMLAWVGKDLTDAWWRRLEELGQEDVVPAPKIPVVMVAWCGGYDFGFIDRLFHSTNHKNPFHYEFLDISGLAYGLGFEWDTDSETLTKALDMEPNPRPHEALSDALHQLEMFRRLRAMRPESQ